MTRQSIREYARAIRDRYWRTNKEGKTKILDEFTKTTGLHRKACIRLLNKETVSQGSKKRGRPRKYSHEVVEVLKIAWEAEDRLCSKRLHPFLDDLVKILKKNGDIKITPAIETQLSQISASTIDRLLRPFRQQGYRHQFSTTRPGSLLKNAIPVRTFADWQENRPGFLEVDLVAHCGESVDGFYLNTLTTVDIATGWTECSGVWEKDRNGWGLRSIIYGPGCLSLYWGWIQIMAVSLSIKICTRGVSEKGLLLPAPVLTKRMIAVM